MRRLLVSVVVTVGAAAMAIAAVAGQSSKPPAPTRIIPPLPLKATPPAALLRRQRANVVGGLAGWVRHEGKWFVWYAPDRHWTAVQSVGGIDLQSGDGSLAVGFGFSGWPSPVTFDDVVRVWAKTMNDTGMISKLRQTGAGPVTKQGTISRRVYTWAAYRTDRKENILGVLTIHVFRDDAQGTYGFDAYTRLGPAARYGAVEPTLLRVQSLLFYKPHDPPCVRPDPACEPANK
jgi:hypothetical protein